MNHNGYFYIASPYTHSNSFVRIGRYEKVLDFTVWLAKEFHIFGYSPIVHSHPMVLDHDMPVEINNFWQEWNETMIYASIGLVILQLNGWDKSKGIELEIQYAKELGKPVVFSREAWPQYDHDL